MPQGTLVFHVSIVSIQTDQSRQPNLLLNQEMGILRFNRINPNRSIPTSLDIHESEFEEEFQSYQSKQINPDLGSIYTKMNTDIIPVSIVSIQTDQSRLLYI